MKNLKLLRTQAGLSQQALAEKFNLTQQSIYKYENGLTEPDINTLINLAAFFGTSIDYLVGVADAPSVGAVLQLHLNDRETVLLQRFRLLSPELQDAFLTLVNHVK